MRVTQQEKKRIEVMALYKAEIKPKLIAEKLGVYLSLVYRVVGKESAVSNYARKFGSGRKKLLNEVELDILKGATQLINKFKPVLYFEFDLNVNKDLFEYVTSLHYIM